MRRCCADGCWLIGGYPKDRILDEIETVVRLELRGFTRELAAKLINKNKLLLEIKPNEMRKSLRMLRKLHFRTSDINTHPSILLQSEFQLRNNYQRLQEVGFREITAYRLANVKSIMKKSVHFNQCFNFLPSNLNVLQNIFSVAKVPVEPFDENAYDRDMKLEVVHRMALRQYMLNRIEYTPIEIDEIWHQYAELKIRSLQCIDKTTQLMESTFDTALKNLPKHILTMQPEEIEELLEADNVCGVDVRKTMILGAKCTLSRMKEIRTICRSYNIPEYAIAYSPKLFFMNFNTLRERLDLISKLNRADEFFQHIAIGKVISSIDRIRIYLKTMTISLSNYILNGFAYDKTNPSVFHLCEVFKKTKDEIKQALDVHPHSKRYSFQVIHQNINYLLSQGFTHEDIFEQLHIILYSLDEIKEFFNRLKDPSEMQALGIDPNRLTKSQILRLCVYQIERKCNFYEEGVFLNSHVTEFNDEDSWRIEEIIRKSKI